MRCATLSIAKGAAAEFEFAGSSNVVLLGGNRVGDGGSTLVFAGSSLSGSVGPTKRKGAKDSASFGARKALNALGTRGTSSRCWRRPTNAGPCTSSNTLRISLTVSSSLSCLCTQMAWQGRYETRI